MPSNPLASLAGRNAVGGRYGVDIDVPQADVAKVGTLMARLQAEMGHAPLDAVKWTAWYVAQSLSASTRKAPEQRIFHPNPGNMETRPKAVWSGYVWRWYQQYMVRPIPGPRNRSEVVGAWTYKKAVWVRTDDPYARLKGLLNIAYRGLAKQSWEWLIGRLGKRFRTIVGRHPRGFQSITAATEIPSLTSPAVIMTNKLSYIMDAVKHGGKRGIETAMSRGATAGLRYLDRRIAKGMAR